MTLSAILILAAWAVAPAEAADRFTATMANPAGAPGQTGTAPVSIYISEYTSDEEIQRLSEMLRTKGAPALRRELVDLEKGWLRVGDSLGYPIAIARSHPLEGGGRRVLIVADRPIEFFEIWNNTRSRDYPFAVAELRLGEDGTGEGELFAAASVRLVDGTVKVESYGVRPARLLGARER